MTADLALDRWELEQPWLELGPAYAVEVEPEGLPEPRLQLVSPAAAALVGLQPPTDALSRQLWAEVFSGNRPQHGKTPLSTVYAGHQFGNWAGQLGDGRAHLLGVAGSDADRVGFEVQIKGAGRTPYSRFGDGRAVLRSSLREFIASEAMAALGVPTTRALCLVSSALPVRRERVERAAVVTRLAPSFIRFGHFQHFAANGDSAGLARLLDWCCRRLLPACAADPEPALALLDQVATSTAELMVDWQSLGFVHGVMNTDNMSVLGLTLDYGPFAFVDAYDPDFTPNTSDSIGLYRLRRQPLVAQWNLAALAQALLPLLRERDAARAIVQGFQARFQTAWSTRLRAKLGLLQADDDDAALADDWLAAMAAARADWTLSWRALASVDVDQAAGIPASLLAQFDAQPQHLLDWLPRYRQRLQQQACADGERRRQMAAVNPAYVPRHHALQQVISAAESGDFAPAAALLRVLQRPYDAQPEGDQLLGPPTDADAAAALSCSS